MSSCNCERLRGKVAVVTASTDGIGFAIARRLAQEGAKTVISSRKQANVDSAVKELRAEGLTVVGLTCHVGKEVDRKKLLQRALDEFGGVDILISNAAVNPVAMPTLEYPDDAWDKIMDVNLKCTFQLIKEFTPSIEERGGGSIVIVSSTGGYRPLDPLGPYGVSKTALLGLTKVLVPQLAAKNIRINCLAPGLFRTRFSEYLWKDNDVESMAKRDIPMDRIGEPQECGGAVAFLVSEDASYITGETLVVGGGVNCRL